MELYPILETYGLPGVVIFGLGWALKRTDERVTNLTDRLIAMADARAVDANEHATQMAEVTRSMERATDALGGVGNV